MRKLRALIKTFRDDETGGALLASTPLFVILFMMFAALVFNVSIWLQHKQELQFACDSATRAATLAVEREFPVLESNGKYHVYCMLDKDKAKANALNVLTANAANMKGIKLTGAYVQPTYVNNIRFTSPEWSSADHSYHEKYLTEKEMYENGDFSMYLTADIDGVWTKLLGTPDKIDIEVYSQSMASGSAERH